MKFTTNFRLALLWCFLLGFMTSLPATTTGPAAAIGDVFYLVRYNDASSELFKNLSDTALKDLRKRHDVRQVIPTSYHEIVTTVTQRLYDYQFFFSQLIATNGSTNPVAFDNALDRVMETFSQNMTTWSNLHNIANPRIEGWAATRDVYEYLGSIYFQGFGEGHFPDPRVIPILNDRNVQVMISVGAVDIGVFGATPPAQNVTILGHSTFSMRYEHDNAWRFITWNEDVRQLWENKTPFFGPALYTPYPESPVE